ncbi:MAG: hypothetical protein V4528_09900 [Pseudomonadota bacterium]
MQITAMTVWEGVLGTRKCVGISDGQTRRAYQVPGYDNLYNLMRHCVNDGLSPRAYIETLLGQQPMPENDYEAMSFVAPVRPENDLYVFVSGVGHTHKQRAQQETEGMKNHGSAPVRPEWFYKGNGAILKTTKEPLNIPSYALSGVEEAELVLVYMVDNKKNPHYLGYSIGNEFSDTVLGKAHRHYFAQSKLRTCSVAPELILDEVPDTVGIEVNILRGTNTVWRAQLTTGTKEIIFTLSEIEKLVFQHPQFRQPGIVHYIYLGTYKTSYHDGICLQHGDVVQMQVKHFLWPLVNHLNREPDPDEQTDPDRNTLTHR